MSVSSSNGASVLAGAFTLSIMLLPTVIRTTEERINAIPKTYQSASLALGASLTQTAFKVILPNALCTSGLSIEGKSGEESVGKFT